MNYYNFKNFNQNTPKMDNNYNSRKLFDPYNGLIRGNLFVNEYEPYNNKEPYEIKPMNEQAELLTYINALGFAMTDLNLYLDVYPNDKEKIMLFNQYRNEKKDMLKEYEEKYGPITLNSERLNSYPWAWNNLPWPWDN